MIQNWSFSSLKMLHQCPLSWYAKYVLGEKVVAGSAANFGSQFDQLVAKALGAESHKPESLGELEPGVEEAVAFYKAHPNSWKEARDAQFPINISPDDWAKMGERYGLVTRIDRPIIGYIDLIRGDFQQEILDLKTSSRNQFDPMWLLQLNLYALSPLFSVSKVLVHLLVRTKELKLICYQYTPTHKTRAAVLSTISWLAARARELEASKAEDEIATIPGWHCEWCPRSMTCETSNFRNPGVI